MGTDKDGLNITLSMTKLETGFFLTLNLTSLFLEHLASPIKVSFRHHLQNKLKTKGVGCGSYSRVLT
jgi:hypothetical protein